jgi:hypothetical protein
MLSVTIKSIMLSVVILSVVMPNVVAPLAGNIGVVKLNVVDDDDDGRVDKSTKLRRRRCLTIS